MGEGVEVEGRVGDVWMVGEELVDGEGVGGGDVREVVEVVGGELLVKGCYVVNKMMSK